jgi:hypothetical protein
VLNFLGTLVSDLHFDYSLHAECGLFLELQSVAFRQLAHDCLFRVNGPLDCLPGQPLLQNVVTAVLQHLKRLLIGILRESPGNAVRLPYFFILDHLLRQARVCDRWQRWIYQETFVH